MQLASSGSPLLFQQNTNNFPALNPLLQPPTSAPQLSSSLIQPSIRPPSAFTPLNPANTQQTSSLIQPKLTIGNQPPPSLVPTSQPVQFPLPAFPITQDLQISSPPSFSTPPVSKDPNQTLPPPPSHTTGACKENFINLHTQCKLSSCFLATAANPYSARASLTERIYPSMPTSQAPLQPQQLPPPMNFQLQQQTLPPPTSNMFVPPTTTVNPTLPNVYPG